MDTFSEDVAKRDAIARSLVSYRASAWYPWSSPKKLSDSCEFRIVVGTNEECNKRQSIGDVVQPEVGGDAKNVAILKRDHKVLELSFNKRLDSLSKIHEEKSFGGLVSNSKHCNDGISFIITIVNRDDTLVEIDTKHKYTIDMEGKTLQEMLGNFQVRENKKGDRILVHFSEGFSKHCGDGTKPAPTSQNSDVQSAAPKSEKPGQSSYSNDQSSDRHKPPSPQPDPHDQSSDKHKPSSPQPAPSHPSSNNDCLDKHAEDMKKCDKHVVQQQKNICIRTAEEEKEKCVKIEGEHQRTVREMRERSEVDMREKLQLGENAATEIARFGRGRKARKDRRKLVEHCEQLLAEIKAKIENILSRSRYEVFNDDMRTVLNFAKHYLSSIQALEKGDVLRVPQGVKQMMQDIVDGTYGETGGGGATGGGGPKIEAAATEVISDLEAKLAASKYEIKELTSRAEVVKAKLAECEQKLERETGEKTRLTTLKDEHTEILRALQKQMNEKLQLQPDKKIKRFTEAAFTSALTQLLKASKGADMGDTVAAGNAALEAMKKQKDGEVEAITNELKKAQARLEEQTELADLAVSAEEECKQEMTVLKAADALPAEARADARAEAAEARAAVADSKAATAEEKIADLTEQLEHCTSDKKEKTNLLAQFHNSKIACEQKVAALEAAAKNTGEAEAGLENAGVAMDTELTAVVNTQYTVEIQMLQSFLDNTKYLEFEDDTTTKSELLQKMFDSLESLILEDFKSIVQIAILGES